MSDDELTVEQKEEQRLMKALLGAGKNKPKVKLGGAAASNDAPAPAVEEKAKSPRQAGELPEWKKRQLENEEKIRQQMEKEQKEKEQRIANAHHNPDAADTPLSPRFSGPEGEIHKQHAKQLGQFLEGKTDMKTAKQLAEEEKERLSSIFKEQPKSKKNRFAAVSEQAKANIAAANERNAKEAAEAEAHEKQEAEKQAKQAEELKKERIETAQKQLATAAAHYASDNAKELHTNDFEADIVKEIEALRNDPKSYAAKLRARRVQYEGKIVTLKDKKTGATIHIQTNEGVAAVDDALKALENASGAPLTLERALTRAMFAAVQQGGKVNAVADVASYGKVSGSARQIVYRGPVLDAEDVVVSLLIDDGETNRSRRDALLADKFKHFGIAAATNADGKFNYAYLLLLSNFEEKK